MAIVVVEVVPKKELLDPAGKAVLSAVQRMGLKECLGVRIGKRFELKIEGEPSDKLLSKTKEIARELLANETIEDVISIRVEADPA
mgnify:CR=1 FL=1